MFQRVGGFGSDRLEQTRTGTKPRPSAGRKCNLSVPSASPGARSCYWRARHVRGPHPRLRAQFTAGLLAPRALVCEECWPASAQR